MDIEAKQERVTALEVQRNVLQADLMQAKARGDVDAIAILENSLTTTHRLLERSREELRKTENESE